MKRLRTILFISTLCHLLYTPSLSASKVFVDSQATFDNAHNQIGTNDTIVWKTGVYPDIFMDIERNQITIIAEQSGSVVFNGSSKVDIGGDHITFQGFQFVGGDIGTDHVINVTGSNILLTQLNIRAYTCYKYLRVKEESQYVDITYCNFENRLNQADQNILSLLVDENNPGYHRIQHCSFKNFAGGGNDEGVEPIRIGVSTQADFISRSLVEYCYFTQCNGDGEIISSKASQNVYRFNTFENNPKAELVLRHGSEAVVYGNFFLNGKGGVRVREGQNHYIYNNYFHKIDDRPIFLQNEPSDPLDNINIGFNTIIECAEVNLGASGGDRPTNVTFANNIFTNPTGNLFRERTSTETWIGNIAFGNLGITSPSSGVTMVDPQLLQNSDGFFGLTENSPAIDAAVSGYALIPQFAGMDAVDTDISFDLMEQGRLATITDKDIGCSEYPHNVVIKPIATEANTGPDYNTSMITSVSEFLEFDDNIIRINISPNPTVDNLKIRISSPNLIELKLDILSIGGSNMISFDAVKASGEAEVSKNINALPSGVYIVRSVVQDITTGIKKIHTTKFIKI